LDFNESRDDGVAVASAGPFANHLHLAPRLQTDNHASTLSLNFYRPDVLSDAQVTVSKHWRQQYTLKVCQYCTLCMYKVFIQLERKIFN